LFPTTNIKTLKYSKRYMGKLALMPAADHGWFYLLIGRLAGDLDAHGRGVAHKEGSTSCYNFIKVWHPA
jgi:hypothetical protein